MLFSDKKRWRCIQSGQNGTGKHTNVYSIIFYKIKIYSVKYLLITYNQVSTKLHIVSTIVLICRDN